MADDAEGRGHPEVVGKPSGYAWYVLGVLFLVYLINFVDRQLITILAPGIKQDLGLDDADIGFLYGTAFAVFYALFGIPLGRLADSWHRVHLLTIGLALWSAMTVISGFARNGAMLAGARIGVGVGEASASPAAYSMLSDIFPKNMRATALAVYSAGAYLGGGLSLMIGGHIVGAWDRAYPDGGALGLAGWQIAFIAVGAPGLLLAVWVATLREPARGAMDGVPTTVSATPFQGFVDELFAVIPPFTLVSAARRGAAALATNLAVAALISGIAWCLIRWTGAQMQWICVGIGYYATFSWACSLRQGDRPTFELIWGSPAFLATILSYGLVAFVSYGAIGFAPIYAFEVLGESADMVGLWVGGGCAGAGFMGVILGGRVSDHMHRRTPAGRIYVMAAALLAAVAPIWFAFQIRGASGTGAPFLWFAFWIAAMTFFFSAIIGAVAATTQDLVLPRMRGTAAATLLLSTTLVGLALGPYTIGAISVETGELGFAVTLALGVVPLALICLFIAWLRVPFEAATVVERARAAGEAI
ncbi:MFS transporter [Sphingopyxis sp. H038]|uniref:spinster family MFS transporter n=1 Tax=unclassified Sphingopyxis TaxID=2614943 RepID=UPI00072FC4D7|nr:MULTISPECIES: MFS transporter [unclassified Sphingopyxis]KTE04411.1 MFS transporter [Sphingopyxis sp. H012]KTE08134.1 MFS transporter [Sphingopyxis sp. H093]KTE13388.1 MFS transporter [Sphingopyxis sp. H053]KTE31227.1 MFS transporter [Sphingopyxis sp. H080]KTE36901.1 MFS transporter [Sphingopyxis sp. H038]